MSKKPIRWLLLLGVVGVAAIVIVYRWLLPPFTPPTQPQPNGYDDLLAAAKMLAPRTGFYDEMEAEELAEVVAHNGPALELTRRALAQECLVPLDWSADAQWLDQAYLDRLNELRNLARAFRAESFQLRSDNNGAIRAGFDTLRLGQATGRGGLQTDWLVAQAIHYMGLQILVDQVAQLSDEQCQTVLAELAELQPYLESPAEVIRREQAYYRHTHGISGAVTQYMLQSQVKQALLQSEEIEHRYATFSDMLRVRLAIRRFELAEGRLPNELVELVPQYLSELPSDPFADATLRYQMNDGTYRLYSIGPDLTDDGGKEFDGSVGDLLLAPSE